MSNYSDEADKLKSHLLELERKHRELHELIETRYNSVSATDEVRRMKTMKLYVKDEIHRVNAQLIQIGLQ